MCDQGKSQAAGAGLAVLFLPLSPCPALLPSLLSIFASGPQQVCVLGLHLAKELCEVDEDGDSWLQVTRRLPILPTLFTTLEVSLRMKQNLHFTEAALHLLLTLARTQQVGGKPEGRRVLPCLCWVGLALPVILQQLWSTPRAPPAPGRPASGTGSISLSIFPS